MKNRRQFVPLLTLALAAFVFARPVHALTLVPPSLEYNLDPGQTVSGKVKLFNEGTAPTTVFASTSNFKAKDEGGTPDFDFAKEKTDLAAWISLPEGGLTLNGGDRLEVPITITVPKDAEPGGHYAGIFFGTDPSIKAQEGGQVSIRSLIGTLVIVRISGTVKETASLVEFGLDGGKTTLSRMPVTLFARISNSGNVHVRPEGTVVIKNMFGKETAHLAVNDVNGAVLPDSIRRFDMTWSKSTDPAAHGGFLSEISSEWRNFGLGSYTATLNVTYGQSHQQLAGTTKFMVFPWRLLSVLILGLGIIAFGLIFGIRQYNTAIIRRAKQGTPSGKL